MTERTSKIITFLHFWMVILVVQIHAYDVWDTKMGGGKNIVEYIEIFFSQAFCRMAVPSLFLISGYLFFQGLGEWRWDIWFSKIKKRIKSLLIPYVIWNVISFFVFFSFQCIKQGEWVNIINYLNEQGNLHILWDSHSGWMPIDFPLWYIRDLMVVILITPLIFLYVKITGLIGVLFLGGVHLIGFNLPHLGWGTPFFFSLGCYLQMKNKDLFESLSPYRIVSYIFTAILLLLITVVWGRYPINGYLHSALMIAGSIAMIQFVGTIAIKDMRLNNIAKRYSCASFFIFAIHVLVITVINYLLQHAFAKPNQIIILIGYFAKSIITVYICIFVYFCMKKVSPSFLNILIGNR